MFLQESLHKYFSLHGPISVNGILTHAAGSRKTIAFYDFCDSSLEVWKKNFLETLKNWNKKWWHFNILEIKCCLDLGR